MALEPDNAFDLQAEVVAKVAGQRASWVALAEPLAAFHSGKGWEALEVDSFNEWLAQPEISLSRGEAYAMIGAWRELVVELNVDAAYLAKLDLSKVAVVLPAIKRGDREAGDALADCENLSRSDLRAEYQSPSHAEYRVCETCGQKVKLSA